MRRRRHRAYINIQYTFIKVRVTSPFIEDSTTVIDNNFSIPVFKNAYYQDLQPIGSSSATPAIDFSVSLWHWNMTSSASATVTHPPGAGRTALILLDRSSSGWTPTWTGVDVWAGGTEPVWSTYRYWHVSLVRWDNTVIRGTAVGFPT